MRLFLRRASLNFLLPGLAAFLVLVFLQGPVLGGEGVSGKEFSVTPGDAGLTEPPVFLDIPGVPNLWQVTPGLYRGGQPTAQGMAELEKLGVKTVVNIRKYHSDRELMQGSTMDLVDIPTTHWSVKEDRIVSFLKVATDSEKQPVFIHCWHGSDRTGLMVAAYRVTVQGWTKEQALSEMTGEDFGFHRIWWYLKKNFLEMDTEKIREQVGLAPIQNP